MTDNPPPAVNQGEEGLSTSELLTKTLALWTRNIRAYVTIAGVMLALFTVLEAVVTYFLYGSLNISIIASDLSALLTILINGVVFPEIVDQYFFFNLGISLVFVLLGLVIIAFVMGSTIKFALDDIATGKPDISVSLSKGIDLLVPMILIQLVMSLVSGALLAPGQSLMAYGLEMNDLEFMTNGLALFFTFGILSIILLARIVASPALAIAQNKDAIDSLNTSYIITRGKTVHILLGWVLVVAVIFFIDFMISYMLSAILFALGADLTVLVVTILNNLFLGPIYYIFYTIVYVDLITSSNG